MVQMPPRSGTGSEKHAVAAVLAAAHDKVANEHLAAIPAIATAMPRPGYSLDTRYSFRLIFSISNSPCTELPQSPAAAPSEEGPCLLLGGGGTPSGVTGRDFHSISPLHTIATTALGGSFHRPAPSRFCGTSGCRRAGCPRPSSSRWAIALFVHEVDGGTSHLAAPGQSRLVRTQTVHAWPAERRDECQVHIQDAAGICFNDTGPQHRTESLPTADRCCGLSMFSAGYVKILTTGVILAAHCASLHTRPLRPVPAHRHRAWATTKVILPLGFSPQASLSAGLRVGAAAGD